MTPEESVEWTDWIACLDATDPERTRDSLRDLAQFANPAMVEGLGLGMTRGGDGNTSTDPIERAWRLAENLDDPKRRLTWTVDPFNPPGAGQIIRTTSELLEGAGICLDFVVTFAAMCVRERVPCVIAIARPNDSDAAHAFVVIESGDIARVDHTEIVPTSAFCEGLAEASGIRAQVIDVTPADWFGIHGPSVRNRSESWLKTLQTMNGHVFMVDVEAAMRDRKAEWKLLPDIRRDLGVVGYLPNLPADHREFASHNNVRAQLTAAQGTVVICGTSGSGKSTLALEHAATVSGGKGWFLDGTDERTLRGSLASAEARSAGNRPMNLQPDYLKSMTSAALRRLRTTNRPWVVVVDNAEGDPSTLHPLLPTPRDGQLVIITTTRSGWEHFVGDDNILEVGALHGEDLILRTGQKLENGPWLPGLRRIAENSALQSEVFSSGVGDIAEVVVSMALDAIGPSWSTDPMGVAIAAASFMPAERITVGWLTEAAFEGSLEAARTAVQRCVDAGFFEESRQTLDVRVADEAPIWMHRLVRAQVRSLLPDDQDALGWRVLENYRPRRRLNHYTDDEVIDLYNFLEKTGPSSPTLEYGEAVEVLLDMLEARGSEMIKRAWALATKAMGCVDPRSSHRELQIHSIMLLARARYVNQASKDAKEVEEAIEWCREAEMKDEERETTDDLLRSGRASAMRGILLKRLSSLDKSLNVQDRERMLMESIAVLDQSYRSRREALEQEARDNGSRVEDPDQHIDRGWFNLGGANVALTNAIRKGQLARVPETLRQAMIAYAGSLHLRRQLDLPPKNSYTAASLWGVALTAYTAALYCPNDFDLTDVEPVEELEAVLRDTSRTTLLRAAEIAGQQALNMRAVVDSPTGGDTNKARDLMRKISMAWVVDQGPTDSMARALLQSVKPYLDDVDITFDDIVAAVTDGSNADPGRSDS